MRLRQEDIAAYLNVSRQTISKYERGDREPDFYMLNRIADYYQVSIDFLFGRTPIKKINYPAATAMKAELSAKVAEEGDWKK